MEKINSEIRSIIKSSGIRFWQIADRLNISEATMTRKMRHELSEEEKTKIMSIINEIRSGR